MSDTNTTTSDAPGNQTSENATGVSTGAGGQATNTNLGQTSNNVNSANDPSNASGNATASGNTIDNSGEKTGAGLSTDTGTQAALQNIAQGKPVPDAPLTSAGQPGNDPSPSSGELQQRVATLEGELSTLTIMFKSYLMQYHRNEGWLNDDGSFNTDE